MQVSDSRQASRPHAFNDSVGITGVIITKLDGTAKGRRGALSAVSETKAPIAFIGIGETPEDFEKFEADRFISRLLGMGDLKSLMEKAEETLSEEDVNVEALIAGVGSLLKDMYKQLEAMNKMGPLKQIMSMLPMGMGGVKLSDEMFQATSDKMKNYRIIMDSMTEEELTDPKLIGGSRIKRDFQEVQAAALKK